MPVSRSLVGARTVRASSRLLAPSSRGAGAGRCRGSCGLDPLSPQAPAPWLGTNGGNGGGPNKIGDEVTDAMNAFPQKAPAFSATMTARRLRRRGMID